MKDLKTHSLSSQMASRGNGKRMSAYFGPCVDDFANIKLICKVN